MKTDAIFVNADYRLLPEASAEDILDDLEDLYKWVGSDLQNALSSQPSLEALRVDLDRVLVAGGSAGGYLSIQTALGHFNQNSSSAAAPKIRAVVAAYPMLDFRSAHWTKDYYKLIPAFGQDEVPNAFIDEFFASVANVPKRAVVTEGDILSPRIKLAIGLVQRGRFLEALGEDRDATPGKRRVHPEDRVADGSVLPPVLLMHGKDDSAVPVTGTEKFYELLRKYKAVEGLAKGRDENDVLKLVVKPGEHGFDGELDVDSTEWLQESVAFVKRHWLA